MTGKFISNPQKRNNHGWVPPFFNNTTDILFLFLLQVFLASHPDINKVLAIKMADKSLVPAKRLLVERKVHEATEGSRFFPQLYATFQTKVSNFIFHLFICEIL